MVYDRGNTVIIHQTHIRDEVSALGADLIPRGNLYDDDFGWDLIRLWHPVGYAVLRGRPGEVSVCVCGVEGVW